MSTWSMFASLCHINAPLPWEIFAYGISIVSECLDDINANSEIQLKCDMKIRNLDKWMILHCIKELRRKHEVNRYSTSF